jgi:dipeptidyl-peptidase 4
MHRSNRIFSWRRALPLVAGALLLAAAAATPASTQQHLRTQTENSGFTQYTRYDSMMVYLRDLQALSPDVHMSFYGTSWQGRELPYLVMSRPMITRPAEAIASGKPIVVFQTNVHGGERTQRESVLILLRDLATRGTDMNRLLDEIVLVVVPQVNPDGFETGNNGQRGNAWGIDLNRDYIKLEQPEIHDLVTNIYVPWNPHMVVDGHNGGPRPYNMTYIGAHHASVHPGITEMVNFDLFQYIRKQVEADGMKAFWYPSGNAEFWGAAPAYPRISMTYTSFRNALGVTMESPAQSIADGVRAGVVSYAAILEWVVANKGPMMATVEEARNETLRFGSVPGQQVAVEIELVDYDFPVSYEIPDPQNPGQFRLIENATLRQKPVATKTRDLPWAYILPRDARDAVALLIRHGITVETLTAPATLPIQAYSIAGVRFTTEYNHTASPVITVADVLELERAFPAGTFIVRTGQTMGRLVAHMLEAESDDNVILWNRMDAWLPLNRVFAAPGQGGGPGGGGQGGGGGGFAGGGGGGGAQQQLPPLVPIFKLLNETAIPTQRVTQVR